VKALEEAQREVLAAMRPLPETTVALAEALGLALARAVTAPHPVPPFANSAVDGFAVRSVDTAQPPVTLHVVEDVPAGTMPSLSVSQGTAIRIMTGAPIPGGADAVVMVEDTEAKGDRVVVGAAASAGDHVRPAGGDLEAGATVFDAGDRLTPAHLGVLASIGVAEPPVRRRPRVAILSTGDELVTAGSGALEPGLIRDSNGPMLGALLGELGADVIDIGIVPDDERRLRSAFGAAAGAADAVVTSGGVSMGEHDLVRAVLADLGGIEFWQVAMQPAKPFAFGFIDDTPLFGLPGNPVSAFVAFEQFVRPALLARMGAKCLFRPRFRATLEEAVSTNPDKTVFLRVTVADGATGLTARPAGHQASNVLSAVAGADAFGVIPVGVGDLEAGEAIIVEWFGGPEARSAEEALG
jgi:molybdopterin molybdotransferase